jgi:glutamate racemase
VRLLDAGQLLRTGSPDTPGTLVAYTSASATALSAAFNSLIGIDPPVHEATFGEA